VLDVYLLQVFNGLSVGSILLLVALGLAFSFGLMGVINMAHGEFIMIGAYAPYVLQMAVGGANNDPYGLTFIAAIPLAFIVTGLLGIALERSLIRFLYGRPLDTLLATWGVGLMLQQAARSIFGAPNVQVVAPHWLDGGLAITEGLSLPYKRLFIMLLVISCVLAIWAYLTKSSAGRRMRAVMQNRDIASCLGVPTRIVDSTTFGLGAGLAGVAGVALTLLGPIGPALGTYYIVDAFMVVVLGGVGQLAGTIAAALSIGLVNTTFELWSSATVGKAAVLVLVILFLRWKPAGLVALRSR
jgi:urea transport system permease protein